MRFWVIFLSLHCSFANSMFLSQEQLEDLSAYRLDEEYLKQFPSSLYTVYETFHGHFYIENPSDCIKNFLISNRSWEPHVSDCIQKYGKPGSIMIDIGAYIGVHTLEMSRVAEVVIAFEPQKKIARELICNLDLNGCKNVLVARCLLGENDGAAFLGFENASNEGSRYVSQVHCIEEVPMRTLDSFHFDHVSLIKIDTENMEKEVLEGSRNTILRNRPILIIEVQGNYEKSEEEKTDMNAKREEVLQLIRSFEYEVFHLYLHDYLAFPMKAAF